MAKKSASPSSDVYTAILALACLAALATVVFVAMRCIDYYGSESLLKIAAAPR
ncbi:MAG: hypothetical protein L0Y36_09955 [Planctomycetales bacterium]|nr:hypothetical protein [Planctomycetales bacterium]